MFTPQSPIASGFGAASTAADVVNGIELHGKTIVVTGGASGIGLETVRAFHARGAQVIVAVRDVAKAREVLTGMPEAHIDALDLIDPASIDRFAGRLLSWATRLDVLVNNAGIMATPLSRDGRGYESQFATNHLGHFHLTCRLWPALVRASGARVVTLSSRGHRRAGIDFHDLHFERRAYDPWTAYGQSKTANALFSLALDAMGRRHDVRAFAVHPGAVLTPLARYVPEATLRAHNFVDEAGNAVIDLEKDQKTPQQGAATSVWCATSPRLDGLGGVYCADCDIAPAVPSDDSEELHGVRPRATDPIAAGRLWEISERLTGATIA